MCELYEIELRENAESFFKSDSDVREESYMEYMHPIYRQVLYRRLRELDIPQRRFIFPSKWACIASKR